MKRDRHGLPLDPDYWTADDIRKARRLAASSAGLAMKYGQRIERFKRSPCIYESRVRVAV